MAVDVHTDLIAGVQITLGGWAHGVAGNRNRSGCDNRNHATACDV
jgi:hypothetical protein